jgi:transposase
VTVTLSQPLVPAPECASLEEARVVIAKLRDELRCLRLEHELLLKKLFGKKSEKLSLEDGELDLLAESAFPSPAPATAEAVISEEEKEELLKGKDPATTSRKPRVGRHPIPEHVETEVVRIEISEEEKNCPCCQRAREQIGEDVTEELDLIPAHFVRRQYVRPRLACTHCRNAVVQPPLPPRLIEKGRPGPGLLSAVFIGKYLDHLPLYRQEKIYERAGLHLSRQTLSNWVEQGAFSLLSIYEAMKVEAFTGNYIQVDETPVKVLDPDQPGKAAQGYLWVYACPGGNVLFEYADGRSHVVPKGMLEGFSGTIQCDGFSAYETLLSKRSDLSRIGCWGHVRRKFVDAVADDQAKALWFLREIRDLYRIEALARQRGLTHEERGQLRKQKAPSILARIKARLDELSGLQSILPKSLLGKAIRYAVNEWSALEGYAADGTLEIDNNLVENAIRPAALGRKNWLFIGHPTAGWRSAVIYSVVLSCKRHGINPGEYLEDIFKRLPTVTNQTVAALTPARWKQAPS